eukprot:UN14342
MNTNPQVQYGSIHVESYVNEYEINDKKQESRNHLLYSLILLCFMIMVALFFWTNNDKNVDILNKQHVQLTPTDNSQIEYKTNLIAENPDITGNNDLKDKSNHLHYAIT